MTSKLAYQSKTRNAREIGVYVRVGKGVSACVYVLICALTCACVCVCVSVCEYANVHACVCVCVCLCMCVGINVAEALSSHVIPCQVRCCIVKFTWFE